MDKDNVLLQGAEAFVKKWGPALKGITDPYIQKATAVLYENQAKYFRVIKDSLNEDLSPGATTVGNLGTFQKWAFPMIRRVYPQLIANAIVGQQPMQGPVGQVFYLGNARQYGATRQSIYSKYQLTYRGSSATAIGFPAASGIDLDVNPSPLMSSLMGRTRGSASTTFGGQVAGWPVATTIHPWSVSSGEYLTGTGIPEVNISIEQQPVVARTKKMRTLWTIEANQDLKAYHNLDLEKELTDLMGNEMRLEIDRELVENLRGIAYDTNIANGLGGWYRNALDLANSQSIGNTGTSDNFTPTNFLWSFASQALPTNPSGTATNVWVCDFTASAFPFAPQHIGHVWSNLYALLDVVSQDIYATTFKSPGSWLITSPLIGAMLEVASKLGGGTGVEKSDGPTNMGKNITLKGKLGGKYDLYIDPMYPVDEILMGRTGDGPMDQGFAYCPYIPIEPLPTVIDPENFQPRKGILTRYGTLALTPESRHYRIIRIVGPTSNYLIAPFGQATGNTPA